jgi:Tfp pilus assembly protein FimT
MFYGRSRCVDVPTALAVARFCFRGRVKVARAALRSHLSARRIGFSLIEVLLVLTLLFVIGALTMPILVGTISRSHLRNSGDVLRAALTNARLAAMESGEIHIFRCELKGRRFQVGSLSEFVASGDKASAAEPAKEEDEPTNDLRLDREQLPSGVTFASAEFAPSMHLTAMLGDMQNQTWSLPIVFQPDGTSTDATMLLANENEQGLRITVRGVTGSVFVGDIGAEAVPVQ